MNRNDGKNFKQTFSLSAKGIEKLYPDCPYKITVERSVTSTNTVLEELARQGGEELSVLIAEEQTEGQGRLGRRFESPKGTGLYMSLLLRPKMKPEEAQYITTSAAVAVAKAIEVLSENEIRPKIKWVNDIYVNDLKVCGILTKLSVDFKNGGVDHAILGIGVNLFSSDILKEKLPEIAGGVFDKEFPDAGNRLAAEILKQLQAALDFNKNDEILSEYRSRSYLDGKSVTVFQGNDSFEAEVLGIDDKARLIVRSEKGITSLNSGEVSIKAKKHTD